MENRMPQTATLIRIYIVILTMTTTLIVGTCYAENVTQEYFIISSGSLGGNYNKSGDILARSLNKINSKQYMFRVITSNGSIENIKHLKDRFSDFAIVQRDVFINNYFGYGGKIKNVSIIAPLFQEKLLIYTHENTHISFKKFKEIVNSSQTKIKIGLTSLDGAAYKTFSEISSLLGLNNENFEFIVDNYNELSSKFYSKKIDYILTLSLPLEEISNAYNVYFVDSDIRLLTRKMRYLTTAHLDKKEHKTLGVWALFIGLNSSINQIGENEIIKQIIPSEIPNDPIENQMLDTFNKFKSTNVFYDQYLNGLPVITSYQEAINQNDSNISIQLIIIIISLISIISILALWLHYYSHKHRKYLWVRYKHVFFGLLLVFIIYVLCIEWLIFGEKQFFQNNGVKSNIIDMTRNDLHIWNLVRIFANNEGGMFPISVTGKLATTLSMYIIWIGGISIAIFEFFMYKLIARRREGLMKIKYEEHIIIAGWSDSTLKLIETLLYACKEYHRKTFKIVCVVPDPKLILEKYKYISDLEHRKEIILIKGYIRNKDILEQCNTHQAKIIILLAEEAGIHADEKTLMRALGIRKFCCDKSQNAKDCSHGISSEDASTHDDFKLYQTTKEVNPVYIIAEVNTEEFVSDLRDAGVNGIINKNKIADSLLVQSILNPGVSILIKNILSFNEDTNEFYTIDLLNKNNSHLRNRTFDELLLPLRKKNILLIAIKVIYRDSAGKEIIDNRELNHLLKSEGLNRQIITNPITDVETNRKTDADDQLITLATSVDKLNAGLKEIKFD